MAGVFSFKVVRVFRPSVVVMVEQLILLSERRLLRIYPRTRQLNPLVPSGTLRRRRYAHLRSPSNRSDLL
jgi:hypothetical protein